MEFSECVLASLDLHLNGSCNIERINQFSDGNLIYIGEKGYLQVSGWNLIAGQAMSADTESYLTLIPKDNKRQTLTARIAQRMPRADVAEYYKLPTGEGLWSGIRSSASLNGVQSGKYEISIDTRIGSVCMRALSSKVIVVAQQ